MATVEQQLMYWGGRGQLAVRAHTNDWIGPQYEVRMRDDTHVVSFSHMYYQAEFSLDELEKIQQDDLATVILRRMRILLVDQE